MPTYEYKCTKCGHQFEAFQSISELPIEKCPKCNEKVERLISGGAGLIFKGSGFYITDYKKSGQKKESTREPAKKESKDKAESKSKPASDPAKPETKSSD